tara:strand:+ start:288 stop:998 length:711 start_codon:yes stop_codon:yes gene_type:complete
MINVDRIYQRVLTLANKEQRGYITPQEFNLLANHAQMDIFEQYFYDLNQFRRLAGNDTVHADMVDILEEKISVFEETGQAGIIPNNPVIVLNTFNPRFYRLTSIRDGNIFLESVSKKDFFMFQNSPLAAPTPSRPIYMMDDVQNVVIPAGLNPLTNQLNIDYILQPRVVNWPYVVVGGKALFNANADDRQDFDLHPSEETELVLKILSLAGFTLKDINLYNAAAGEDNRNIQQEKQ